jgi:hypothetical protein
LWFGAQSDGLPYCLDTEDVNEFRDADFQRLLESSSSGRLGAGLGCYRWDRGGLGRKAERIDLGEQLPAPGVLLPQLQVHLPLPPADFVYSCSVSFSSRYGFAGLRLHPQLVMNPALLFSRTGASAAKGP